MFPFWQSSMPIHSFACPKRFREFREMGPRNDAHILIFSNNIFFLFFIVNIILTSCFLSIKEFVANTDQDTVVYHDLSNAIQARYIRFRPTAWHGHISMRVEVYGCKGIDVFLFRNSVIFYFPYIYH